MGTETEFKFAVDQAAGSKMLDGFGAATDEVRDDGARDYETVYFDTDGLDLKANHVELRLRRGQDGFVQTIKAPAPEAGAFTRAEHETSLSDLEPDLVHARAHLPRELKKHISLAALAPKFSTRFTRHSRMIANGSFEAEASLDLGFIEAGDNRMPICEVEFELKGGEAGAYSERCLRFLDRAPAALLMEGKAARGYRLVSGKLPEPVFAKKATVTADTELPEAIVRILRHNFAHFLDNHAAVTISGEAEAIHQMRVGMRRLRAALQAFAPVLDLGAGAQLINELKSVFAQLGEVRVADVFLGETVPDIAAAGLGPTHQKVLQREISAYRDAAHSATQRHLNSPQFARFVVRLNQWIEAGDWLKSTRPLDALLAHRPVGDFAAPRIDKLHKTLRKRVEAARTGTLDDWHRARIAAKKLRYAREPLAKSLPGGNSADDMEKRLSKLQDALGRLNDLNAITSFLGRVETRVPARSRAQFKAAAQFCRGWGAAMSGRIIDDAERAMRRFESGKD